MADSTDAVMVPEKAADVRANKVRFGGDFALNMRPVNGVSRYHVTIEYDKQTGGKIARRLDFSADYQMLYRIKEDRHLIVALSKYDFFINRKQPSGVMEQLAAHIAEATGPVTCIITPEGAFRTLYKPQQIRQRWKSCEEKLRKEYQGALMENVLSHLGKKFSSPVRFEKTLYNDLFHSLFFTPLYGKYGKSKQREMKLPLPIISGMLPALFTGVCTVNPELSSHNSVELSYEAAATLLGKEGTGRTTNNQSLQADLQVDYDLDDKTHLPVLIKAHCEVTEKGSDAIIKTIDMLISRTSKPSPDAKKQAIS